MSKLSGLAVPIHANIPGHPNIARLAEGMNEKGEAMVNVDGHVHAVPMDNLTPESQAALEAAIMDAHAPAAPDEWVP